MKSGEYGYQSSSVTSSGSYTGYLTQPSNDYYKSSVESEWTSFHEEPIPMLRPSQRRQSGVTKRSVFLSDRQLVEMAADTANTIEWSNILTHDRRWKRIDDAGGFVIHSKKLQHRFAVLAVGVLPCSVPEVVRLLHSPDADKFLANMEGVYGDEFKDGSLVHRVNLRHVEQDMPNDQGQELMDLTVKSVLFHAPGLWRPHREKWTYLEAAYRRHDGRAFEKLTTTLSQRDVNVPSSRMDGKSDHRRSKRFHDVITGFCVEPEESDPEVYGDGSSDPGRPGKETRVYFYGEFNPPARRGFSLPTLSSPAGKAIKQRLVSMARSCDRLTSMVRRRRLGVQVLVDRHVFAMMLTSPSLLCVCCSKSIKLLSIKQCRICGQGVCGECSQKYERETKILGSKRLLLENIRVCDRCLDRVDRSDYTELNDASLLGPTIHPNEPEVPTASCILKDLLKDELLLAASPARKATLINVIKCVLNQEEQEDKDPMLSPSTSVTSNSSYGSGGAVLLPSTKLPSTSEDDVVNAINTLNVEQIPFDKAELSTTEGRTYPVDPNHPDVQIQFPVPEYEAERLQAMDELHIQDLINNSEELNLICELASKEMGTFASLVTIVTADELKVVASNVDALQNVKFARSEAFCAHTIMSRRPIVTPHPEADIRFHQCGLVKNMGIRYYCGFPLINQDDTVIGVLCCINKETRQMNETQFNAMYKLAETTSKVIQVQGRKRTVSMASSESK